MIYIVAFSTLLLLFNSKHKLLNTILTVFALTSREKINLNQPIAIRTLRPLHYGAGPTTL